MGTEQLVVSIGTILLAARLLGSGFQYAGQPRVVGEMTAGIVLGPSFLGIFFPSAFAHIFPASSLPTLTALSQLGLLLFMFAVGLEVDLNLVLKHRLAVVLTSNLSIFLPLVLGAGFAAAVYPALAGERITFVPFALFVGTAMSVTAFPVLARILKERNLLSTELGTIAISCAAVDDVTAWLLLAFLTAVVHSAENWSRLVVTLLWLLGFLVIMLVPVRRAIAFFRGSLHEAERARRILLRTHPGYAGGRLDDRAIGSSSAVWSVCSRPCRAESRRTGQENARPYRNRDPGFSVAAVLCSHGFEDANRPAKRWAAVELRGGDYRHCHRRQSPGSNLGRANDGHGMENRPRFGGAHEHARAGRTGSSQCRAGTWHLVIHFVHHDGDHGPGHNLYDHSPSGPAEGRGASTGRSIRLKPAAQAFRHSGGELWSLLFSLAEVSPQCYRAAPCVFLLGDDGTSCRRGALS